MLRSALPIVAVAMLVGVTSTASAQVSITYGPPMIGRWGAITPARAGSVGQPFIPARPDVVGRTGLIGQPVLVGPGGAPSQLIAPYTTGTTFYSTAYTGYVAPGTTLFRGGSVAPGTTTVLAPGAYPSYPLVYSYGYGPNFRAGNPRAWGWVTPGGGVIFNRGVGIPRR